MPDRSRNPRGWSIHAAYTQTMPAERKVPGMSLWAVLLRVLLSVALILNGATTAMASVQMTHEFASKAATSVKTTSVEMPCHQHQQSAVSTADAPVAPPVLPSNAKHPAPDCCKSSACRCACLHAAPAAVPMMAFTPVMVEHTQSVRPMSLGHAAPALPHLIRPPIG